MIIKITFGVLVFLFVIFLLVLILPEILYMVTDAFEELADLIRELRYQMQKNKSKKTKAKPATNFERIKAMSVAEFARFIEAVQADALFLEGTIHDLEYPTEWEKWLEAKYEESGDL